jgi:adenine phosphoribosyltransferase
MFRDIMPLLADAQAFRTVTVALDDMFHGGFDVVAGLDARGFLLAGAVALLSGTGLVPIRKAGKLPRPTACATYALEYGTATLECQGDLAPGTRVLIVDDVLATGGTLAAAQVVLGRIGAVVVGSAVLMELPALGGRAVVPGEVRALFTA